MLVASVAIALSAVLGASGHADDTEIRLRATPPDDIVAPAPVLDQLADGDVLDMIVSGGVENARGVVRQCLRSTGGFVQCVNEFPVQFGDRGDARFQYQLVDTGYCGAADACVVVVDDLLGLRRAYAFTVFGADAPPPPVVAVAPAGPYEEGDEVAVEIGGLAPGARVQVSFCDPACGTFTRSVADAQGRATATVVIGRRCDRCGIAVVGGAHDSLTAVQFAAPPSPEYEPRRLAGGLVLAAALLVAARWIIATTDWRPPSEAATPELEAAEL